MQFNVRYIILFSLAVCIICSLLVSSSAVLLEPSICDNALLYKQKNVLMAVGMIETGQKVTRKEVDKLFENIEYKIVDLKTGEYSDAVDAKTYDQVRASKDPSQSFPAPENRSKVKRLPKYALVYHVMKDGQIDKLVLPIEGYGLWSTLYGFLALEKDGNTVVGIAYYEHGETPGLGGEVDNPKWRRLWKGRRVYDENGEVKLAVIKGPAGPSESNPHQVDGLSGATITSRGVTNMMKFWFGDGGFGPYLKKFREEVSRPRGESGEE